MTRIAVYGTALVAFAAATAMTIAANLIPRWVVYTVPPPPTTGSGRGGEPFWQMLGLHRLCSSEAVPSCRSFPQTAHDCGAGPGQEYFCSVWRSVSFMMALALVVELVALVGFVVVMAGGRQKREGGWRVLGLLLAAVTLLHVFALSTVAFLLDHDDRFLVPGWRLDASWILCTASACFSFLCTAGLALSAFVLPPEDGYDFLRDPVNS